MSDETNCAGTGPATDEPLRFVDPVELVEGGVPDGCPPDDGDLVTGDDPDFDQDGVA